MADLSHDFCCEIPQLIMSDGREASSGAAESMINREGMTIHNCWVGWPAASYIPKTQGISECSFMQSMLLNGQDGQPGRGAFFTTQFHCMLEVPW